MEATCREVVPAVDMRLFGLGASSTSSKCSPCHCITLSFSSAIEGKQAEVALYAAAKRLYVSDHFSPSYPKTK